MQNFKVGDKVFFKSGDTYLQDTIKYMDCDVIQGEIYDLTFVELGHTSQEILDKINKEAEELVEKMKVKAEELFLQKALKFPEVFNETHKEAFILIYIEGFAAGYAEKKY
jgi:hypothetical protein